MSGGSAVDAFWVRTAGPYRLACPGSARCLLKGAVPIGCDAGGAAGHPPATPTLDATERLKPHNLLRINKLPRDTSLSDPPRSRPGGTVTGTRS